MVFYSALLTHNASFLTMNMKNGFIFIGLSYICVTLTVFTDELVWNK